MGCQKLLVSVSLVFQCGLMTQPDVAAPGVHILAAVSPHNPEIAYNFQSGTSMATPHVSGIVALLKSLHPDWSPAAIKSALVTTGTYIALSFKYCNVLCYLHFRCMHGLKRIKLIWYNHNLQHGLLIRPVNQYLQRESQ